jgi:hypothetical protein
MSRPRTVHPSFRPPTGEAEPTSILMRSAVCSPIIMLYVRFMWLHDRLVACRRPRRAATRTSRCPRATMMATSVVPPPMSTIMLAVGFGEGQACADGGGHRLLDEVDLARARARRQLSKTALLLDGGDAAGHATTTRRAEESCCGR